MSERSIQWLEAERGNRSQSKRRSVQSCWQLCELLAEQADDTGVYAEGVHALAARMKFSERYTRMLLDRLEAGETIRRIPRYHNQVGRLPDAIVLGGWTDQRHRRPMKAIPKALRLEDED